jgi:hypothetical protein
MIPKVVSVLLTSGLKPAAVSCRLAVGSVSPVTSGGEPCGADVELTLADFEFDPLLPAAAVVVVSVTVCA